MLGACSGAVAGLVCITPALRDGDTVGGYSAGVAGGRGVLLRLYGQIQAGLRRFPGCVRRSRVGGTLGAMLTGVFATKAVIGAETPVGGFVDTGSFTQIINQVSAFWRPWRSDCRYGDFAEDHRSDDRDSGFGADELQGLDVSQHGRRRLHFPVR